MLNDPSRIFDGSSSFLGGMDAGREPHLIGDNQVARAVNVAFRNGSPHTRPPIDVVTLHFESADDQTQFEGGILQGAHTFYSERETVIIAAVGGRMFRLRFETDDTVAVAQVTPVDGPNSSTIRQVAMEQAEDKLVIQDGVSNAIIFDGVSCVREEGMPIGNVMAYGLKRLWISDGRNIWAGDIFGGDSEVTKFTENQFLNEGGDFRFPPELGTLRVLVFPPTQDTATGQGELLALGDYGGQSIFASISRDDWKNSVIERITLRNPGPAGTRAFALVNGDVWFRSSDGIRSYRMARARWDGWGHRALSSEVETFLGQSSEALLTHARAAAFDGRLLIATYPGFTANGGCAHRGLVALDFSVISGLANNQDAPAWDGLWTGVSPTEIVVGRIGDGRERCFIFSHDSADTKNRLYELQRDGGSAEHFGFDNRGTTAVAASIESRAFTFLTPFNEKPLCGGDIWVTGLTAQVPVDVRYRPDAYPCWVTWTTMTECADNDTCGTAGECVGLLTAQPQYRSRLSFPTPRDTDANPVTHELLTLGSSFQVRLAWEGPLRLKLLRVHARKINERTSNVYEQ